MWKIAHHPGHHHRSFAHDTAGNFWPKFAVPAHLEHLSDRRFGTEILTGRAFRDHSGFRLREKGRAVSCNKWKPDDLEEVGAYDVHMIKELAASRRHRHPIGLKMGGGFHFRELSLHRIRPWKRDTGCRRWRLAGVIGGPFDTVET